MIPLPDLINRLAAAGARGVPLSEDPVFRRELDLCRSYEIPIRIQSDRVFLIPDSDALVPVWIEAEASWPSSGELRVIGFLEVGSTNDETSRLAQEGAPEGLMVCAESQTSGRGRMGRGWISHRRAGLYYTLLLRPCRSLSQWPLLGHAAAVAVARSVEEFAVRRCPDGSSPVELKWPNDVLLCGRKTAGILLEVVPKGRFLPSLLVGIGINIECEAVPQELRHCATSVSEMATRPVPRRRLLVRFLHHFRASHDLFQRGRDAEILDSWKSYCRMWDGVPVQVVEEGRSRSAVTCGLSELGALKVRTSEGKEEILTAGEVSVRRL